MLITRYSIAGGVLVRHVGSIPNAPESKISKILLQQI
jgi:hypothetical protein